MKFTRRQELTLIDYAFKKLLESLDSPSEERKPWNKGKKGIKWSKERRAKYAQTMKKKWAHKHE